MFIIVGWFAPFCWTRAIESLGWEKIRIWYWCCWLAFTTMLEWCCFIHVAQLEYTVSESRLFKVLRLTLLMKFITIRRGGDGATLLLVNVAWKSLYIHKLVLIKVSSERYAPFKIHNIYVSTEIGRFLLTNANKL